MNYPELMKIMSAMKEELIADLDKIDKELKTGFKQLSAKPLVHIVPMSAVLSSKTHILDAGYYSFTAQKDLILSTLQNKRDITSCFTMLKSIVDTGKMPDRTQAHPEIIKAIANIIKKYDFS